MNGYTNMEKIKKIDAPDVILEMASDLRGLAQVLNSLGNGCDQIMPATCAILADTAHTMADALEKVGEFVQPAK